MLLDHLGRKAVLPSEAAKLLSLNTNLHPLDDPEVWKKSPAFEPPPEVDVQAAQNRINSIWGTAAGGGNIFELVWTGDVRYWFEWFMSWNILGQPDKEAVKRPRVRYCGLWDDNDLFLRDVFPPRWQLLKRVESVQIADDWKEQSYYFDPHLRTKRQIRPDTIPNPFWENHAVIADHNAFCCATRRKNKQICYGTYMPPSGFMRTLELERKAVEQSGEFLHPFAKVSLSSVELSNNEKNGYRREIEQLKVESQVYLENPFALIGLPAAMRLGIDTQEKARRHVREYFKRKIDEVADLHKL